MTERPLADRVRDGDPRAIARAISLIEDEAPVAAALVGSLFPDTGRAYLIGVTGPPGAGKSTLVDRLTAVLRKAGRTVGVLAVDPTSPYSGGAVLGDRVRMQAHAEDEGVFIPAAAHGGTLGAPEVFVQGEGIQIDVFAAVVEPDMDAFCRCRF